MDETPAQKRARENGVAAQTHSRPVQRLLDPSGQPETPRQRRTREIDACTAAGTHGVSLSLGGHCEACKHLIGRDGAQRT